MSLRIFISHTSRSARSRALAVKLHERLEDKQHLPRVDLEDLRSGDLWRNMIDSWIANCEAAIVVLDADALESDWVAHETSLLVYEHSLHSQVPGRGVVLLVVLDGIDVDAIGKASRFEPIDLDRFQVPRVDLRREGPVSDDLDEVVDRIIEEFESLEPRSGRNPFDKQTDHLSGLLDDVSVYALKNADEAVEKAWAGSLPALARSWAPRDPHGDTTPAAMAAGWLLNHALVTRSHARRSKTFSAPEIVCKHLQPTVDHTHHEELLDTLFSGWISNRVTHDLVRMDGPCPDGGRADIPFTDSMVARLCFWAALVRSEAANPRRSVQKKAVAPWLDMVSPGAFEDSVESLRDRVERGWKTKFNSPLGPYIDGDKPVGVGLRGDARLGDLVDSVLGLDHEENQSPDDPEADVTDNVLSVISYVLCWDSNSATTTTMSAHPAFGVDGDPSETSDYDAAVHFAKRLHEHIGRTLKVLCDEGLELNTMNEPESPAAVA